MNVALIQCPGWVVDAPPHGLAVLSSSIRSHDHVVNCFDLNVELYNKALLKSKGYPDPSVWYSSNIENYWSQTNNVVGLFHTAKKEIAELIEKLNLFKPDAIGFTVHYTSVHFAYWLSKMLKTIFPNTIICWGGPYCFKAFGNLNTIISSMPEIDVVCTGDGENSFATILKNYEQTKEFVETSGYYFRNKPYNAETIGNASENISKIAFADAQGFAKGDYTWKYFPMLVSKGCVNRCAFCYECKAHKKYSFRDPERIVEEIVFQQNQNPQIEYFWLTCSNIGGNIGQLTKMCEKLCDYTPGIKWISQIAIHEKLTPQLVRLMKNSGCAYLYFGIESGSTKVLKLMNKHFSSSLAKKQLLNVLNSGIGVNFNLVVGFPGETTFDFLKTLFFIKKFLKYNISPSVATCKISEGSRLHRFADKYEVVNPNSENWSTKDGKNNLMIRNFRKKYADKLYGFRLINLFRLSLKFNQYTIYVREKFSENKPKRLKGLLAYIAAELIDLSAYPLFLLWIGLIAVHLKLIETIQVFKVKS